MAREKSGREDGPERSSGDLPTWAKLHLWQIQPVRDVLLALAVLGLFTLGSRLSIVTVPLLLALLFAYLLEPVVARLARFKRLGRRGSVVTLLVATTALVIVPTVLGAVFGALQLVQLASRIGTTAGVVIASVDAPEDDSKRAAIRGEAWLWVRDLVVDVKEHAKRREPGVAPETPEAEAGDEPLLPVELFGIDEAVLSQAFVTGLKWLRDHGEEIASAALSTGRGVVVAAVSTIGSLARLVFGAFLTAFFFFFASWRWGAVREYLQGLLPENKRGRTVEILVKMDRAIAGFVRGRLTIAFILSIFYAIGFWLIGVPAPLVLGPAIALLSIIPYAAILGLPVVIVLLLLEQHTGFRGEWWWAVFAPIVYYNIGQALDDYVLTPWIQGESTGLDAPAILFASIAGGALMGFFGLLVAIPLAACVKILATEVFWPRFHAWTEGKRRDFLPIDGDT